ncbi:MAG TPA: hypothetical protein VE969_05505 [Pyrinomonadaceae bacterium]|nr:hypothetical protein [Pyrinomonadaceae bacterium]
MVTLFITALAIIFIAGIGLYFWQKSMPETSAHVLPPPPDARGLFEEHAMSRETQNQLSATAQGEEKSRLLALAKRGERSALDEAHATGDANLYDHVLSELVTQADTESKLLSLASHVARNELPVNAPLANAMIASWKAAPDRNRTAKALHFAALSDDAALYRESIEDALQLCREGKLADVTPAELWSLFDGEFWILSSRSRSSGAGFVLKQTLADARRELEAAGRSQKPWHQ